MAQAEYSEFLPWLRLVLTPGVGPQAARKLLQAFGSAQAIFEQSLSALGRVVSARQAQALVKEPDGFEEATQKLMGLY